NQIQIVDTHETFETLAVTRLARVGSQINRTLLTFGPTRARAHVSYHLWEMCMNKWSLDFINNRSTTAAKSSVQPQHRISTQIEDQPRSAEAQQQSQQSQQLAQQNQARADKAREGKRRTHNDAAQAHSCIEIDKEPGLFGGFKNTCDYKVNYDFCNFKPKKDSWASSHDCEKKHGIGADAVGPGKSSAAHNRNTEMVYWFACKDPSWPVDSVFVLGKGIEARCHN
ncbi:hypothetical protein, partial [Limnohabitans sp.]|uniref:hypothetical protein n=1 Tax=Limnohabitans sp. TaxID=1907725 RepID=UPI0037BED118